MPLTPSDVGSRVVVRRLVPGEVGPSGGPLMTDVLGVLEVMTDDVLQVRREDGTAVSFPRSLLVTGKPVPPRAAPRLRIDPGELQRICSAGWPARTVEPLGDWLLREAGGFTGRANSALVVGDPGHPVSKALQAVEAFYSRHRLSALAQVVLGSPGEAAVSESGWVDARPKEGGVLVQVASVAQARRRSHAASSSAVEVSPELSADCLAMYSRVGDPPLAAAVLCGGGAVGFARVGSPAVAIGRGVVTGDWLGVSAVEVAASHRRRGLARAVFEALLSWGAEQGALSVYLQVTPDNEPAITLYESYGFVTHHRYRYLRPPR